MAFTSSRREHGRRVFFKSKKDGCTIVNSHVNSSEKKSNFSNSENVIGNSNLPSINFRTKISLDKIITLQK